MERREDGVRYCRQEQGGGMRLRPPPSRYEARGSCGAWARAPGGEGYPERLRRLDPPPVVYGLGRLPGGKAVVAVVGTRSPRAVERAWAAGLGAALGRRGVVVCSGFAPGIDRAAHRGALAAGGATIAVLGDPVTVLRGRGETDGLEALAAGVVGNGALLSEHGAERARASRREAIWNLLSRNRIIAALSDAVVVVSAHEKGGAHVTADWACRLGLPLWVADFGAANPIGNLRLLLKGAEPLPACVERAAKAVMSRAPS